MRLFGILVVPDNWRWPRLLTHVFDNESTTISLGYLVFFAGVWGALFSREPGVNGHPGAHSIPSDDLLWYVIFASILVGGKLVSNHLLEALQVKLGGGKPADAAKEVPPNAPPAA